MVANIRKKSETARNCREKNEEMKKKTLFFDDFILKRHQKVTVKA
jgi:hypothetical protein